MASNLVLGLDLGPNSVGWALVDDNLKNPSKSRVVDMGVRVFPEGVDAFDTGKESSRSETRRVARGMRRQTTRRVRRRRYLKAALIEAGLWPADDTIAEDALYGLDPYYLRARALHEKLSPHELGRVFLHLSSRRGFKSNRKRDRADSEVKGMLAEINENEAEREAGGFETIGAWLADKCPKPGRLAREYHTNRQENDHDRVRNRHLARSQYEDEFEAIWTAQAKHNPKLLVDKLKYGCLGKQTYPCKPRRRLKRTSPLEAFGIHGLVFYQRSMYWPKSVVGLCELEPKQKRCPRSDRRYQRFRLLQEVNNLRFIDPDQNEEHKLTDDQRQLLLEKLSRTKEMTFDQIRKALGFLESVKFNLERGQRSKLLGVPIDAMFAAGKVLGKKWYDRPEGEKTEIVRTLLDNEGDDESFIEAAVSRWNITSEQAEAVLGVDLPAGYGNLSLKALERLLPHMEKGLIYMADDETNSAMHAAGYFRRDQLQRRIFDKLPIPQRVRDCPIGDIPNPVVKRTLTEVRRVINSIIHEHGKPDAVHIEMARSVQQGSEKRKEASKRMRAREKQREDAAERIRDCGARPTREKILKYLLWEQQCGECIFSGKPISLEKLYGEGGGVEIEHVLPRSRSLEDSQMNKVVCLREENADKGNRTPYEWLADTDPGKYDAICQRAGAIMRAGKMPYAKYRRFIQKELDTDQFAARQLTDTGYIAKATAEYVSCLFDKKHKVLGLKGQLTSELRWHWGLETVLEDIENSPAWVEQAKLRPGEKNRADHRHHAIDALVVALTNRSRLQQLSDIYKRGGAKKHGEVLPEPWDDFRKDILDQVKIIKVSHRVERKVRGALHEETFYGPTQKEGEWVVRKALIDLSANEICWIRDIPIRELVKGTLKANGLEFGRGKKLDPKKMKEVLNKLTMPSGVPIRKVRLIKKDKTIQPIRKGRPGEAYVKPGKTHHLCIFEWEENGKTKRDGVFVTRLEASRRVKNHEPIIQRDAAMLTGENRKTIPENARFVMSLTNSELVLAKINGIERLLKLRKSTSTVKRMTFQWLEDARREYKKIEVTCNSLFTKYSARKVTVDPLGRIRWAND